MNGRLGDDAGIGNFTLQSAQGKSESDYVLFAPTLFDIVRSFSVHDISVFFFFSDHAPIKFTISSVHVVNTVIPEQQCEIKKILLDADKVTEFRDVLNTNLDTL